MVTSGKESIIDLSSDYIKKYTVQTTTGAATYQVATPEIASAAVKQIMENPQLELDFCKNILNAHKNHVYDGAYNAVKLALGMQL